MEFAEELKRRHISKAYVYGARWEIGDYFLWGRGTPWFGVAMDPSEELQYAKRLYFTGWGLESVKEMVAADAKVLDDMRKWRDYLNSQGIETSVIDSRKNKRIILDEEIDKKIAYATQVD